MTQTNTGQMVADLQANNDAINAQGWIAPGLGRPNSPLGFLNADLNPLSGLAAAGLSWFMPLVSFLGEGLTQLQGGNGASVSSGSQDFGSAGTDLGGVAGSYRQAVSSETSGWTGAAADQYRATSEQQASGIEGLGGGSTSTASAIVGAGQVVAQCIAEVTELIAEAVSQIVPIMTQAVARAGETNGESIAEAIPPCIAIAVEYALRIAAKLAALMASGDNLMKLVQGAMAIVDLLGTAMSSMSQQSVQPQLDQVPSEGQQGGDSTKAASAVQGTQEMAAWDGQQPSTSPTSSGGSGGGGASPSNVASSPGVSNGQSISRPDTNTGTHSSSVSSIPAYHSPTSTPIHSSSSGAGGYSGGRMPMGEVGVGPADRAAAPSSRTGVGTGPGAGSARQGGKQQSSSSGKSGTGMTGGMPMGGMGARPGSDSDKEHTRKYELEGEQPEELEVAPEIITAETFKKD